MTESTCQGESRNCLLFSDSPTHHLWNPIHTPHSEPPINNCHQAFTTTLHWEAHLNAQDFCPQETTANSEVSQVQPQVYWFLLRWVPQIAPTTLLPIPTGSPWHSLYHPSVSTPLSNSASFPFPFISAYVKIESAVLRTTGIPHY